MRLHRAGAEFYAYKITTTPPVAPTDWELSIDGGTTWADAQADGDYSVWLIAGPDYPGPGDNGGAEPAFTATDNTDVLVRLIDSPETVIWDAPQITIWS
ncbi:hypothetical protein HMPREF0063_11894 [Aeromicrobium marinum DSM 15272]|uniref:Uncharacterized protein n=1 Tax=Aeromicrobium marinum DSM 15272 TaxID=585531 RepID=E2SDV8_9ACTN|nr:hypothetical protein [Aeromicrobium marinum]EFQ82685.1 hypothetical protein HMPREF0063_11894 [Aeromicrobium marinum DSM 15272]